VSALAAALRRLLWAGAIIFGVTTVSWVMTALLPGDPVQAALGPQASPADVQRAREIYGFDGAGDGGVADRVRRGAVSYGRYLGRLVHVDHGGGAAAHASCGTLGPVHLDLGTSFTYRKPVVELVKKRLPASLELAVGATLIQLLLGLSLGAIAAARRGGRGDRAVVATSVVLGAAPTFVVGLLLQYTLAYRLGWAPLDGRAEPLGARLHTMMLPAITLGLYGTALFIRLVRAELSGALGEPFVRAARGRGASRLSAGVKHALRNALAPIVQLGVLDAGALIGGAIVTERIFRWPGLGELAVVAVQNRDAQAIVGVTLVGSAAVVLSTLVADLAQLWLDPRARGRT
jgi:peptide/nickel transport system permease protein